MSNGIRSKVRGLIAAPPTPFSEDGSIDWDVIPCLATHLYNQGVVGVFLNGTTGEGVLLTVAERKKIVETWKKVLHSSLCIFVHVGSCSLRDAQDLTEHAGSIGVDAISSLPPIGFLAQDLSGTIRWCAEIAKVVLPLPFYFYHIPSFSKSYFSITTFLQEAKSWISNLQGVKFTYEQIDDYAEALILNRGEFDVLWGRDEMLLAALAFGCEGAVGSTYNLITPHYLQMIRLFRDSEWEQARQYQHQAIQLIRICQQSGNFLGAIKHLLSLQGVPIRPITRTPSPPLHQEQLSKLTQEVKKILPSYFS